jgi:hypothetical protein
VSLSARYLFIAMCMAFYYMGLMHGTGRKSWITVAIAMIAGVAWPLMAAYGIWLTHFDKRRSIKK